MVTISEYKEQLNKKYGNGTIVSGGKVTRDAPRIPTGIYALDLITGGGIPIWRTACFWGPSGSGKSTLAMMVMIGASRICWRCFRYDFACVCDDKPLKKKSAYVDVEGTFDAVWAESLGLRQSDYVYISPDTGESAVNIADKISQADDCGLVIVDSLAMLEPSVELDSPAEDMQVGLQARLVAKMFRKVTSRIIKARKEGRTISAIFVNQIRAKIGGNTRFMAGDPESQPGGYAAKFAYSLSMRIGSRYINPSKEATKFDKRGKPLIVKSSIRINKHKLIALGLSAEYEIVKTQYEDYPAGTVLDIGATINGAKEYGLLRKCSRGWILGDDEKGTVYRVQKDLIDVLKHSPKSLLLLKYLVVEKAKQIEMQAMTSEDIIDDRVQL